MSIQISGLLALLAACATQPTSEATGSATDTATSPTETTTSSSSWPPCIRGSAPTVQFTALLEATEGNPLKGLLTNPDWGAPVAELPHSLEFAYVPLADLMDGPQSFSFETGLEPRLEAAEGRDNHLVLRVYLDYPAGESGVPDWLSEQIACTPYTSYGGGCSPDYSDPDLQSAVLDFISALGSTYDGDPRLGFVQLGLLGYWGEWHTYPETDLFADEAFQQDVISAFDDAFDTTPLQIRTPAGDVVDRDIGYHDDSFAYSTIGEIDWFFLPTLEAAGADTAWERAPIGGEVYPDLQESLFTDDYTVDVYSQDFDTCVAQTHATYLLNYAAFNMDGTGYTGDQLDRARESALSMGYAFAVRRIWANGRWGADYEVWVNVKIENIGVAPFYHPITLQLDGPYLKDPLILTTDLPAPGDGPQHYVVHARDQSRQIGGEMRLTLESPALIGGQRIRFANVGETGEGLVFPLDIYWDYWSDPVGAVWRVPQNVLE